MHALRSFVSAVTALAFFVQSTGLAYAAPPSGDVQPVPYAPTQPVPTAPPPPPSVPPQGPASEVQIQLQPGTAPAPSYVPSRLGSDAIYLKGGGMLRGTLIEMLPNDHATIQLATGQNAVVEWGKIDRIEAAQGGAIREPGAPYHKKPRPGPGPTVFVHVEGDEGVVLDSIAPGSVRWTRVCVAPCDAELPLTQMYRIDGENIRRSRPFSLSASPGQHVVISVSPASKSGFAGGVALASVGVAALTVGLVVLLVGAVGQCSEEDEFGNCYGYTPNSGLESAGGIISLAGVGLIVGGVILLASNSRTRETQRNSAFERPAHPDTAWLRAPTWHDTVRDSVGQPKAMGLPLFTQRF